MTRGRKAQNGKEQSRRTREHVLERAWKKREKGGYWGNDKHLASVDIEFRNTGATLRSAERGAK